VLEKISKRPRMNGQSVLLAVEEVKKLEATIEALWKALQQWRQLGVIASV
jgi:hypothetical protein